MPTYDECQQAFTDQRLAKEVLAPMLGKMAAERNNARQHVKHTLNEITALQLEISNGATPTNISEKLKKIEGYLVEKIRTYAEEPKERP